MLDCSFSFFALYFFLYCSFSLSPYIFLEHFQKKKDRRREGQKEKKKDKEKNRTEVDIEVSCG